MSSRSSTTLWVIIAVIGMGLMQWITRSRDVRLPPGPGRGDIVVQQDVLDTEIGGWTQVRYTPAKEAEELPDGQFWWSFTWQYQRGDLVALVSLDQADWDGWHELTVCYRAIGWELTERDVLALQDSGDTPVIAKAALSKELTREQATLVFSEFDQDAEVLAAPILSMQLEDNDRPVTLMENLNNRVGYNEPPQQNQPPSVAPTKVLQAQVFLPHQRTLTDEEQSSLLTLHTNCLRSFQGEWIRQSLISNRNKR